MRTSTPVSVMLAGVKGERIARMESREDDGQQSFFELGTALTVDRGRSPIIWPMDFFPAGSQVEHLSNVRKIKVRGTRFIE